MARPPEKGDFGPMAGLVSKGGGGRPRRPSRRTPGEGGGGQAAIFLLSLSLSLSPAQPSAAVDFPCFSLSPFPPLSPAPVSIVKELADRKENLGCFLDSVVKLRTHVMRKRGQFYIKPAQCMSLSSLKSELRFLNYRLTFFAFSLTAWQTRTIP